MKSPYPFVKVIAGFTLLGGALGGLLIFLHALLTAEHPIPFSLESILYIAAYGAKLGTIPAALTGLWLAWWRVARNALGLLHAFFAGACFSALFAVAFWLSMGGAESARYIPIFSAIMALVGAASAIILGALFLPKAQRHHP